MSIKATTIFRKAPILRKISIFSGLFLVLFVVKSHLKPKFASIVTLKPRKSA